MIHQRFRVTTLRSILVGIGVFLIGSVSDAWLLSQRSWSLALLDDAVIAIVAGGLVFLYERRQTRNIIRKLNVIRLMNHHVRNSLQVISFAASDPKREELATELRVAMERIEWALREVLPGQREDADKLLFQHPSTRRVGEKSKPLA